jgi:hypothetical protein
MTPGSPITQFRRTVVARVRDGVAAILSTFSHTLIAAADKDPAERDLGAPSMSWENSALADRGGDREPVAFRHSVGTENALRPASA